MSSGTSLAVAVGRSGRALVVHVTGEADLSSAGQLEQAADQALAEAAAPDIVVMDLSEVTFMDSSGLRVLTSTHEKCHKQGTPLHIVNPTAPVRRVIDLMGLDRLLTIDSAEQQ